MPIALKLLFRILSAIGIYILAIEVLLTLTLIVNVNILVTT